MNFRCFPIFRTYDAVLGIPEHHDYFLKQLFFFAFSDMLIVVWDLSVGSILPSVILDKSLVKKFVVQFTQVAFYISYVVRRSGSSTGHFRISQSLSIVAVLTG